jgi:Tol biopolymer transport system component
MYWSPDSAYIVFTQYVFHPQDLSFSGDIYTIGADGSDKAKLTKKTTTCDWYIPLAWR